MQYCCFYFKFILMSFCLFVCFLYDVLRAISSPFLRRISSILDYPNLSSRRTHSALKWLEHPRAPEVFSTLVSQSYWCCFFLVNSKFLCSIAHFPHQNAGQPLDDLHYRSYLFCLRSLKISMEKLCEDG